MTSQEILDKFTTLIEGNMWWRRFVNSQFMNMLAIMASQVIYASQTAAEKELTEGFISTASKRTSILAAAEDRGYIARQIQPSYGTSTVTNKTQQSLSLAIYTNLISDEQKRYMLMEPVILKPGEVKTGVATKQLERERVVFDVPKETEFSTFTLSKDMTKRCVDIDVFVTEKGVLQQWKENHQFRLSNKDSRDYVKFYRPTEQIGVRFGDGSTGKMPASGEQVILDVWLSEGDITLVQGQSLTPYAESSSLAGKIEIKTDTPITNGAGYESTEETRLRAQYFTAYDNQVVWDGDYKHFLRTHIPNLNWVNVWGEEEQERSTGVKSLENINRIFFCGHKKGFSQAQLGELIISTVKTIPNKLNTNFFYVNSKEKPFTISVKGSVRKGLDVTEAERQIREQLENKAGRNSNRFERKNSDGTNSVEYDYSEESSYVSENKVWAIIENTKLLSEFKLEIKNQSQVTALNDFIYLNVTDSKIELDFGAM